LRKPRLKLVSSNNAGGVFDDLEKLREDGRKITPQRRRRSEETFARFPHDRALKLYPYRLTSAAWVVLIELDRVILKHRGQNPVRFVSGRLREIGLTHHTRRRALRQLAAAGVIKIRVPR
jgi:hypothetical protein